MPKIKYAYKHHCPLSSNVSHAKFYPTQQYAMQSSKYMFEMEVIERKKFWCKCIFHRLQFDYIFFPDKSSTNCALLIAPLHPSDSPLYSHFAFTHILLERYQSSSLLCRWRFANFALTSQQCHNERHDFGIWLNWAHKVHIIRMPDIHPVGFPSFLLHF